MSPAERMRRGLLGGACLLVLAAFASAARSGPLEAMGSSPAESYYNLLVRGFQAGHLSLAREVPAALAQLPDPLDPAANVRLREAAAPLHDLSYYQGKLYLYFGVGPALVLFWPWAVLTGAYLSHRAAAAIFCALAFLAGAALLRSIQRRYFPDARPAILAAGALALGLASGLPILLARADVYEVAIAGGAMGMVGSLAALWQAFLRPRSTALWLAAASLAYGLAVACRPSLLPGSAVLLLPVFWGEGERRRNWRKNLAAAAGPLVVVGLGLLAYNAERFGQPLEFGQRYQLAGGRQEGGGLFTLRYLWFNFRVYFLEPVRWSRSFPFVEASTFPPLPTGHRRPEDPFGVLFAVPVVWLALAAPLAWWRRSAAEQGALRAFIAAVSWVGGSAFLVLGLLSGNASRYEVDFLPELLLLAALGGLALDRASMDRPGWRRALAGVGGLLLAGSVVFTGLAAVAHYAKAQSDLGGLLLDAGKREESIRVLDGTLQWQPALTAARIELGNAYVQQGRLADAQRQFAEALRRDPEDFEARANLANVLVQTGRFEEGAEQYRQLLRLRPDFVAAERGLGFALTRLGRRDEAMAAYEAALRLDPADAGSRDNLGSALAEAGRTAEAVAQFRAALRTNPGDALAHGNLGLALAQLERMDEAADEFRAAVRLNPASGPFHRYLGTALADRGRLDEAIAEFEAALRINPADATARENLALARGQRGRP